MKMSQHVALLFNLLVFKKLFAGFGEGGGGGGNCPPCSPLATALISVIIQTNFDQVEPSAAIRVIVRDEATCNGGNIFYKNRKTYYLVSQFKKDM